MLLFGKRYFNLDSNITRKTTSIEFGQKYYKLDKNITILVYKI